MTASEWQLVLPADRLARVREDRRTGCLLALARAANAISIVRGPLLAEVSDTSPATSRERFSALFYCGGVLYEAFATLEKNAAHFAATPAFTESFGELLSDAEVAVFRAKVLERFRHKGVFHFDAGFFRAALSQLPTADTIVARYSSPTPQDTHFTVADDLLFAHLLGPFESEAELVAAFTAFAGQIGQLANRFIKASHRLLPSALAELGLVKRRAD